MRRLVVLVPEGLFVDYFVYCLREDNSSGSERGYELERDGRINFRGSDGSNDAIRNLIGKYKPEAVAIRVLYGGSEFKKSMVYDKSLMRKLEKLVAESPLHIPIAIKLIRILERTIPTPEIILFFETAFFADLPVQERTFALGDELVDMSTESFGDVRRFGYHGLFHEAIAERIGRRYGKAHKIISICLEPVPEVAAVYYGKPIMVSSGATPLDGIPGDTTCGRIDPGIVLFIEEKKKWGPEMINEMLTRKSGLSAIADERVSISEVFADEKRYDFAGRVLEYSILLSCGSAIALMDGVDAVVFSGKYIDAAEKLSESLITRFEEASVEGIRPPVFFLRDPLEKIIAENCFRRLSPNI